MLHPVNAHQAADELPAARVAVQEGTQVIDGIEGQTAEVANNVPIPHRATCHDGLHVVSLGDPNEFDVATVIVGLSLHLRQGFNVEAGRVIVKSSPPIGHRRRDVAEEHRLNRGPHDDLELKVARMDALAALRDAGQCIARGRHLADDHEPLEQE